MFGLDLLVLVIITSVGIYIFGMRWMGLSVSLRPAVAQTAETAGVTAAFLVLNVGVIVVLSLVLRALGFVVSLYLATDAVLVILSSIQAVVFQSWRYSDESGDG